MHYPPQRFQTGTAILITDPLVLCYLTTNYKPTLSGKTRQPLISVWHCHSLYFCLTIIGESSLELSQRDQMRVCLAANLMHQPFQDHEVLQFAQNEK